MPHPQMCDMRVPIPTNPPQWEQDSPHHHLVIASTGEYTFNIKKTKLHATNSSAVSLAQLSIDFAPSIYLWEGGDSSFFSASVP